MTYGLYFFYYLHHTGADSTSHLNFFNLVALNTSLTAAVLCVKIDYHWHAYFYTSIYFYGNLILIVSLHFKTVLFCSNEKGESLMLPKSGPSFKLNYKRWIELVLEENVNCPTSQR